MPDLSHLRALAEAANRPEPRLRNPDGSYAQAEEWNEWDKARRAYLAAVSDPAVVLALLAVAETVSSHDAVILAMAAGRPVSHETVCDSWRQVLEALSALTPKETTDAR